MTKNVTIQDVVNFKKAWMESHPSYQVTMQEENGIKMSTFSCNEFVMWCSETAENVEVWSTESPST